MKKIITTTISAMTNWIHLRLVRKPCSPSHELNRRQCAHGGFGYTPDLKLANPDHQSVRASTLSGLMLDQHHRNRGVVNDAIADTAEQQAIDHAAVSVVQND